MINEEQKIQEDILQVKMQKLDILQQEQNLNDEDYFQTEEELRAHYSQSLTKILQAYNGNESIESYSDLIRVLKRAEQSIIKFSIFSMNEHVSEVQLENLSFILLPFLIAYCFNNISQNRMSNVQIAKQYFNEYFKLLDHYQIIDSVRKKQWKAFMQDKKYALSRDENIQNFKDKKSIANEIQYIEKSQLHDEKDKRKYYLNLINLFLYESIVSIKTINEEIPILEYKQKIEKDDTFKKQHEQQINKSVPPIKFYHIPKLDEDQAHQPYLIQNIQQQQNIVQEFQPQNKFQHNVTSVDSQCHLQKAQLDNRTMVGLSSQQITEEFKSRVWQPGYRQPTVSLEQFAEGEMEMLKFREEQKKDAEIKRQKERKESFEQSDDEERDDQIKKKERQWDDWKDDHEKGGGNKKGK